MLEKDLPIVRAIIATENDDVLVVRRKYGRFAGKWELPGGRVKPQEDLISGLIREVREEVGISLDPKDVVSSFRDAVIDETKNPLIGPPPGFTQKDPLIGQTVYLFQTKDEPDVKLGEEHNRFRLLSPERFAEDKRTSNKFTHLTTSSLSMYFYAIKGLRSKLTQENAHRHYLVLWNKKVWF